MPPEAPQTKQRQVFLLTVNDSEAWWSTADEAAPGVLAHLERQRGVVVVMERAERLVAHDPESESLRDPLNRQVAKLLKLNPIHSFFCFSPQRHRGHRVYLNLNTRKSQCL